MFAQLWRKKQFILTNIEEKTIQTLGRRSRSNNCLPCTSTFGNWIFLSWLLQTAVDYCKSILNIADKIFRTALRLVVFSYRNLQGKGCKRLQKLCLIMVINSKKNAILKLRSIKEVKELCNRLKMMKDAIKATKEITSWNQQRVASKISKNIQNPVLFLRSSS